MPEDCGPRIFEFDMEDLFTRFTLVILRRIQDGGYFPLGDYLQVAEEKGGVAAAKMLIHSEAGPVLFQTLVELERDDLAIERCLAPDSGFRGLFDELDVATAGERFRECQKEFRADPLGRPYGNLSVVLDNARDLENLRRRRLRDYSVLSIPDQVRHLECELAKKLPYPFTVFPEHRLFFAHHPKSAAEQCPLVAHQLEQFDKAAFERISAALEQFEKAMDFSEERCRALIQAILPEDFDAAEATVDRARKVLQYRAVHLARMIADYLTEYGGTYPYIRDQWLHWRYAADPGAFPIAEFIRQIPDNRFYLLVLCLNAGKGLSFSQGWFESSATVCSMDDVEEVPGVFTIESFPPVSGWVGMTGEWVELGDMPPDVSWDSGALLEAAHDAAVGRIVTYLARSQVLQSQGMEGFLVDIKSRLDSIDSVQRPIMDLLDKIATRIDKLGTEPGGGRRERAEESLRSNLGDRYARMCAEARAALVGAEYLFQDPQIPDPNVLVLGLAIAFERQLAYGVLEGFCEFLRRNGHDEYPPGSPNYRGPQLMRYRELQGNMTLEKSLQILEFRNTKLRDEFALASGLHSDSLLHAIRQVKKVRNRAAHEGGLSYEYARQLRNRWLCPDAADGGVFAALLP